MTIACYHSVNGDWDWEFAITPALFERHCAWLVRHRRVLPLEAAVAHLGARGRLRGGRMALTFDDGYADFYHHAFPVLKRSGMPTTMFVVTGSVTGDVSMPAWDGAAPGNPGSLTTDQITEMHDAGVLFGSHSHAHLDLTKLSDAECERDLRTSSEVLADLLHTRTLFLAYPMGRNNDRVRRIARRAGFSHAFATARRERAPDPFAVPRLVVRASTSVPALRLKSSRLYAQTRWTPAYRVLQLLATRGNPLGHRGSRGRQGP